jgi:solute carrier family 25 (mitochondrial carnitine/acylcarnitine transporter), member 20/29
MATEGWVGMYRGFLPLVLRDLPAWSSYFWSYEYLKHATGLKEKATHGVSLSFSDTLTSMLCGGIAGMVSWLVSYPFDVLKTHIQTQDSSMQVGLVRFAREKYDQQGYRYFFRGLAPTLVRSFISNAVCLPVFDALNKKLVS